jgi:hypothetical protein
MKAAHLAEAMEPKSFPVFFHPVFVSFWCDIGTRYRRLVSTEYNEDHSYSMT